MFSHMMLMVLKIKYLLLAYIKKICSKNYTMSHVPCGKIKRPKNKHFRRLFLLQLFFWGFFFFTFLLPGSSSCFPHFAASSSYYYYLLIFILTILFSFSMFSFSLDLVVSSFFLSFFLVLFFILFYFLRPLLSYIMMYESLCIYHMHLFYFLKHVSFCL